ncbi:hypothetical protein E2I00_001671, partial [Balaenoptera physalus]
HYTIEEEISDLVLDRIQKLADLSVGSGFLGFLLVGCKASFYFSFLLILYLKSSTYTNTLEHSVYNNLNHIINRIVFSITASLRFYDALHIYVTEFHTNFFSISIPTSLCPHISQLSLLEKPITNIFCSRNY